MKYDDIYHMTLEVIRLYFKNDKLIETETANERKEKIREDRLRAEKQVERGIISPDLFKRCYDDADHPRRVPELVTYLRSLCEEEPAVFEFKDAKYDEALIETGIEFARNGMLTPPFRTFMFYADNFWNDEGFLIWGKVLKDGKIMVDLREEEGNGRFVLRRFAVIFDIEDGNTIRVAALDGLEDAPDDVKERGNKLVNAFYQCLIMLNHPVYEKENIIAPPAVNAKREKKGKTKLLDYIRIKMNDAVKSAMSGSGESRGMVRPHWRRGHIRRCHSGKIVPVQPCMVNWRGEKIEPKLYRVAA
jgi:hypothetical protein